MSTANVAGQTANPLVQSLANQWRWTSKLLRRSIECFDDDQWKSGVSQFEVPWKVAYHTLQCLLFYFRDDAGKSYRDIAPRYGKDWWELLEEDAPTQDSMLEFLGDVTRLVEDYLGDMSDEDLARPFGSFSSLLENYIYAIRHTLHHQGGLNVLSVYHKIDADLWDRDD
jgi:hypothetical protein